MNKSLINIYVGSAKKLIINEKIANTNKTWIKNPDEKTKTPSTQPNINMIANIFNNSFINSWY